MFGVFFCCNVSCSFKLGRWFGHTHLKNASNGLLNYIFMCGCGQNAGDNSFYTGHAQYAFTLMVR